MSTGKVHKFKLGPDCRSMGQTSFEYRHTAECGYVRRLVTDNDNEVTCKICIREIKNQNQSISLGDDYVNG